MERRWAVVLPGETGAERETYDPPKGSQLVSFWIILKKLFYCFYSFKVVFCRHRRAAGWNLSGLLKSCHFSLSSCRQR